MKKSIFVPHYAQQTDSHCGPATLQMLLSQHGFFFSQDQIARAAGVYENIEELGTRPWQIAQAVTNLAPPLRLWWKQNTSRSDLEELIHLHQSAIAVNWQGLFYDELQEEPEDRLGEVGHYSVVVGINPLFDRILIQDPYPDFQSEPREFSLQWFESRWWDRVEDIDTQTDEVVVTSTHRFSFLVVKRGDDFPRHLGMVPAH